MSHDGPGALRDTTSFRELRAMLDAPGTARGKAVSLREGTPEMHYFVARGELASGENLRHGAAHLADLVAADPANREWLALIDAYDEKAGGIEPLLDPEPGHGRYYATEALRAYVWGRDGRVTDAVQLLLSVARVKRDQRYIDAWAPDWLADGLDVLPPDVAIELLGTVLNGYAEHAELTAARQTVVERWARSAVRFADALANDPSVASAADMMVPGLCRKAGLFDEGLRLADRARRERPSWHASVARGLLLRQRRDLEAARDAFEEAIAHEPDNLASYLEAGDMFFENERWTEARAYYEAVLAREPGHDWAHPSALFCRWRESSHARFPDDGFPSELYGLMRAGNYRAQRIYDAFRPWVGYVPEPHDALTNMLRSVLPQIPPESAGGNRLTSAVSGIEPPSNLVLARLIYGDQLTIDVKPTHVATPDPRQPVAPIAFTLWTLAGAQLVPAVPPPPPSIAALVRELASAPFTRVRAWADASRAASHLRADDAAALLSCVVHPPPLEGAPHDAAFEWVPRVQLTVAFVLAHLAPDEPWEESTRRAALFSLLHGPMDWSTEAAIVALTILTRDHPVIAVDVNRAFAVLDAGKPRDGRVTYEATLLDQWLYLPGLYPNEREALEKRYDDLFRE